MSVHRGTEVSKGAKNLEALLLVLLFVLHSGVSLETHSTHCVKMDSVTDDAHVSPAKADYRQMLLPEKRKWSESDQEVANREWQELRDKVSAASSTVSNGGVSAVLVSFRGRIAARREMGKYVR